MKSVLRCFWMGWFLQSWRVGINSDISRASAELIDTSDVVYVHIVGIEGTGHHGIIGYVGAIAAACNYTFLTNQEDMRHGMYNHATDHYGEVKAYFDQQRAQNKPILVLEELSFPMGLVLRDFVDAEEVREFFLYDIVSQYRYLQYASVDPKYLYTTRDFFQSVLSKPGLDGSYEKHAVVSQTFRLAILQMYQQIESMQPGLWRAVDYDWFDSDENLVVLVKALIEFFGLNHCDADTALSGIKAFRAPHHPHPMRSELTDFIKDDPQFRLLLPQPPKLVEQLTLPPMDPLLSSQSAQGGQGIGSNTQLVRLVGLPHSGLHILHRYIKIVAEACDYQVVDNDEALRSALHNPSVQHVPHLREYFSSVRKRSTRFVIVDDVPMPHSAADFQQYRSVKEIRKSQTYDILRQQEWLEELNIDVRYLFLVRDLAEIRHDHPSMPVSEAAQHVHALALFQRAIVNMYHQIESRYAGKWRRFDSSWFAAEDETAEAVRAIVKFHGWTECDIHSAVEGLGRLQHEEEVTSFGVSVPFDGVEELQGILAADATVIVPVDMMPPSFLEEETSRV